jgi:hypothetical protein
MRLAPSAAVGFDIAFSLTGAVPRCTDLDIKNEGNLKTRLDCGFAQSQDLVGFVTSVKVELLPGIRHTKILYYIKSFWRHQRQEV